MARRCSICGHPKRQEIEAEWARGTSLARTAASYGVSEWALARHLRHAQTAVQLAQEREALAGSSLLERVHSLYIEGLALFHKASMSDRIRDALAAAHALVRVLELEARLTGELGRSAPYNVLSSPEWLRIRERIVEALQPYPEAAHAVAMALFDEVRVSLGWLELELELKARAM